MMKPALVLIHGWGQSAQCWQSLHATDAITLSLPGHDDAASVPPSDWVDALLAQLPNTAVCLVGWSLGGQIAMQMALRMPARVHSLVLLATTPCFMQRDDWSHGVSAIALHGYQQGIIRDHHKLLRRFRALMVKGGKSLPSIPPNTATTQGLSAGLDLLKTWDVRHQLTDISCPVWLLHGNHDAVVPPAAGSFLVTHLPHVQSSIITDGCHALPWTDAQNIRTMIDQARNQ